MNQEGINSVNSIINYAKEKELIHLSGKPKAQSSVLHVDQDTEYINFGSCSYLGLEFNDKLIKGSIDAIETYGTQFSSSRAYLSLSLYDELESDLSKLFNAHVVVTPTTTLGHMSTMPIVVGDNDLIILDHQVHNSVQMAAGMLKSNRVEVKMVRHNRLDILEEMIERANTKYDKIWYMADGIYSMYGDKSPIDEVYNLLNKYERLHYYVDDAHAMSCYGKNGRGFVLGDRNIHSKMIVGTSLNKAFASGGGAFIFPNNEMAQKVRNCGGPMITSGPMQPSALGAANACVKMHLSGEIEKYQEKLKENLMYCEMLLNKYELPNLADSDAPIFFVAVSLPKVAYNLLERMKKEGHFLNLGIFPAVPMKNTGIRFTITRLHTFEQIEKMVRDLAHHYFEALKEEEVSLQQVYKAFKLKAPEDKFLETKVQTVLRSNELKTELNTSILDVNQSDWNQNIGKFGMLSWNNLNMLEHTFTVEEAKENKWKFFYLTVRDQNSNIILQTFLTSGLMKDDMLSETEISVDMEKMRENNPYFYTSNFLMVGSLITEGNHLYIDKNHKHWKEAMTILYNQIEKLQKELEATSLMIRDLDAEDDEMHKMMMDNGFFKVDMPDNYHLNTEEWSLDVSYRETLSKRSKRHFKENVMKYEDHFETQIIQSPSEDQMKYYYKLYENVFDGSYEINTFKLPFNLFKNMISNEGWEVISLKLKSDLANDERINENKCVAVIFAFKGEEVYIPALVGLDYKFNRDYNVYRQSIYQLIYRSKVLGYNNIHFGFSAGVEKRKFGAKPFKTCAYMQVKDNYKMESLMTGTFGKEEQVASN